MKRAGNPLWSKAPLLLTRFPGLLAAVAVGALLLALAGAAFPLFVSSAGSKALDDEIRNVSRFGAGVFITQSVEDMSETVNPDSDRLYFDRADAELRSLLDPVAGLAPRVFTLLGPDSPAAAAGEDLPGDAVTVRLLAKTEGVEHIKVVEGDQSAHGFWIAHTTAESLGVKPGDDIDLVSQSRGTSATLHVAGIYRALSNEAIVPYWGSLFLEIYPANPNAATPPAFAIGSAEEVLRASEELGNLDGEFRWEFPIATKDPLSMPEGEQLRTDLDRFEHTLTDFGSPLNNRNFCFNCFPHRVNYNSSLPTVITQAETAAESVEGPAQLLSSAGVLVALGVIAAAGAFAVARRRVEAALLFARGTGPGVVGTKAALECLLPSIVGAALGLGCAVVLVDRLGPGGSIGSDGIRAAARYAAVGIPVSVVLLGLVYALSFLRHSETTSARLRGLNRIPWEAASLALAAWCLQNLLTNGAFAEGDRGVTRPSTYLLLFPIFFIAGCSGLAARSLRQPLRLLRDRSRTFSESIYLVIHRLAGAQRLAILLVTGCALALGVFLFAQTVVTSLTTTVEAKSLLFIGSDVSATINFDQEPPSEFRYPITKVTKVPQGAELQPSGRQADLLAVDPETFEGSVFWDPAFSSESMSAMLEELPTPEGEAIHVVVAGANDYQPSSIDVSGTDVPVRVVGNASAWPNMSLADPIVVADRDALNAYFDAAGGSDPLQAGGASTELWVKGDPDRVQGAILASDIRPYQILTAREVAETPSIAAAMRTFGFLKALGFCAALLVLVAVLMYMQARQRLRIVSYALARRMGLRRLSHRWALALELGGMLVPSLIVGAVLGVTSAQIVFARLDPLPQIPPDPLFRIPFLLIAATGLALLAVSIAGGWVTNRTAEKPKLAEVMRVAA